MTVITITNQIKWNSGLTPLNLDKVAYIVIHHAEASKCSWQDIDAWHKQNGWSGGGYNEFISKEGTVYIMRGDNIGAQCQGFNSCSYGICVEGNYSNETMPQAQFDALVERININKVRFPNFKTVKKHSDLVSPACPGANFPWEQLQIRLNTVQETRITAINKIADKGIISSPSYWVDNAKMGGTCKGEYVEQLIKNMAKYIK